MKRFILDGRYGDLLKYFGVNTEEVLKKAQLPGDTFAHKSPTMTEEEYFRFMDVIGERVTDPEMPIKIATVNKIENFAPPIFASYCSKNGRICIERLARYKRLIGPMIFITEDTEDAVSVELATESGNCDLPQFLVETEFAFLTGMIRRASQEPVNPISVSMIHPVTEPSFSEYLGVPITDGNKNRITFLQEDLEKPFISYDEAMWDYFEPGLAKRLAELEVDDSVSARVRSALTELLPGGACGIEDVAERLGLSRRTLQRKLSEENTTFQKQLNSTREMLAVHYIRNTDMTTNDVAYLLGYNELNSFLRAFAVWTGMGIGEYKKSLNSLKI